jgi:hypothetical protein
MYYSSTVGTSPSDRHSVSTACVLLFTCCAVRRTAANNSFGHCFMSLSPSSLQIPVSVSREPYAHTAPVLCCACVCNTGSQFTNRFFSPVHQERSHALYNRGKFQNEVTLTAIYIYAGRCTLDLSTGQPTEPTVVCPIDQRACRYPEDRVPPCKSFKSR